MGNLYTHIKRRNDPTLSILFDLKQAWRSKPIDKNRIKELQDKLKEYQPSNKLDQNNYKKKFGMFGWKAEEKSQVTSWENTAEGEQ